MIAISLRVPDSITHTPYAIQTCLLTDRTALKYHLFTFPHYTVAVLTSKTGAEVDAMSPSPDSRCNLGNISPKLVWRGSTSFSSLRFSTTFNDLSMPFQVNCFLRPVARKRCTKGAMNRMNDLKANTRSWLNYYSPQILYMQQQLIPLC